MEAVRLKGSALGKTYGSLAALREASIDLVPGRISAIVGENGAGKSTLAKILAGVIRPDAGTMEIDGRIISFRRRRDAIAAGIGFVPQALSFVGTLSLVDNYLLGQSAILLDRAGARARVMAIGRELDVPVVPDVPVERLSLAERQLGEVVVAIAQGAKVLLLDEPTSSLGPLDIERLIAAIRRLAAGGTAIGLVTHRISEVLSGADHVIVLRAGAVVFEGSTAAVTADDVARFMVGSRSRAAPVRLRPGHGGIRISVDDVSCEEDGVAVLDHIGFAVRAGEILGIAGVAGPGQPMLADILAGLRTPSQGEVRLDGVRIDGRPAAAAARGVAFIPEERGQGLMPDLTLAENASLLRAGEPAFSAFGLRRRSRERDYGRRILDGFDVRPRDPDLPASGLSGGNQQKLLVGRELDRKPAVVIAHGPTQGLDLAAAALIRGKLVDAARGGAAVIVLSADLDEIMEIAQRIIVIAKGRITGRFDLGDDGPDAARLGRAMAGVVEEVA